MTVYSKIILLTPLEVCKSMDSIMKAPVYVGCKMTVCCMLLSDDTNERYWSLYLTRSSLANP